MSLVKRIKALCEYQEITLAELERKLDFGNGTIRRWDNSPPSADRLLKVSEFFHVGVDYLLGNEQDNRERIQIVPREKGTISKADAEKIRSIVETVFDGEYTVLTN